MPSILIKDRRDGQSNFGSERVKYCAVAVKGKVAASGGSGTAIILQRPDGTEQCLYFDNSGNLITGTYLQFQQTNTSGFQGTKVGTQT